MLSAIPTHWPPHEGSTVHPETGYKSMTAQHAATYRETLMDLHDSAWWTGLRITAFTEEPQRFRVKLLNAQGEPAFKMASDRCMWFQESGEWVKFPWPIPAKMAKYMELWVDITPMSVTGNGPYVNTRIAFHEVPGIIPKEHLLFFNEAGAVQHYWNGSQNVWGNRSEGATPRWRTVHVPVPPSSMLDDWDDHKMFCIHTWDEVLDM